MDDASLVMPIAGSGSSVVLRRTIEASPEELFDAWLDAESLAEWMRPTGVAHSTATVDPREGGAFEIVMHTARGPLRHTGVYRAIDRPTRLVFTWISAATGNTPSLVIVEFRAIAGTSDSAGDRVATEIVVTHEQLPDEDAVRSHREGWTSALELLARTVGRSV